MFLCTVCESFEILKVYVKEYYPEIAPQFVDALMLQSVGNLPY